MELLIFLLTQRFNVCLNVSFLSTVIPSSFCSLLSITGIVSICKVKSLLW